MWMQLGVLSRSQLLHLTGVHILGESVWVTLKKQKGAEPVALSLYTIHCYSQLRCPEQG
jgi:hypothetical protein